MRKPGISKGCLYHHVEDLGDAKKLAEEQKRLTEALIDLINEARNKGFYASHFDAHAGAFLVQAYTLGMIVDDFVDDKMDPQEWYKLIDIVVDRVFLV